MRIVQFEIENYRGFKTRQTLNLGDGLNVIIGPNGGGKTTLFDALALFVRKVLIAKSTIGPRGMNNGVWQRTVTTNDELNRVSLDRHNDGAADPQVFIIILEVTSTDVIGMKRIQETLDEMKEYSSDIIGWSYKFAQTWTVETLPIEGYRVEVRLENGALAYDESDIFAVNYIRYLQNFENDALLRGEKGEHSLAFPLIYLPSHRAREGVTDSVGLTGQSLHDQKKNTEVIYSKSPNIHYQYLAMQKIVTLFRQAVDCEGGSRERFNNLPEVKQLTKGFAALGYEWNIEIRDPYNLQYEIQLYREGKRVRVDQLSTGESAMLSFIEIVYGLGVTGALILIDEPELHLHPSWQEKVRDILRVLADETNNQMVASTHSPSFVSEETISNVSRVYAFAGESRIQELNSVALPHRHKLFRMVNLQNNAKIFFAKSVLLVEGPSDELVIRRMMRDLGVLADQLEVVSVGGKMMFASYQSLLTALGVTHAVMADRDYLNEVASDEVKYLFKVSGNAIKEKVLLDPLSRDGDTIVEQISAALISGDFSEAQQTWDYILSRRTELKPTLSTEEEAQVSAEIARLADQNVFVLSRGAIEAYLPDGIGKDMSKLVDALADEEFSAQMPEKGRAELEAVVRRSAA